MKLGWTLTGLYLKVPVQHGGGKSDCPGDASKKSLDLKFIIFHPETSFDC